MLPAFMAMVSWASDLPPALHISIMSALAFLLVLVLCLMSASDVCCILALVTMGVPAIAA